jgi:hypothetical protein
MLFPFETRNAVMESLPCEYVATVIADLRRAYFTGFCLLVNADHAVTVLFRAGEELAALRYWPGQPPQALTPACSRIDGGFSENVDVHVLSAAADAVALAQICFRGQLHASQTGVVTSEQASALCRNSPDAVLVRRVEGVCELAAIRDARIWVGYRFDPEAQRFFRVDAAGFFTDPPEDAVVSIFTPRLVHPKPRFDDSREPLGILAETYTAALNLAEGILREDIGAKAAEFGDRLLAHFKEKYPPLYRGLYRNPETGFINWEQLPLNRDKVNRAYRYERFVLYLDEVLLKYLQGLRKESGIVGLERFARELETLRAATPDPEFVPLRDFFLRLEKLLGLAGKS